MSMGWFDRKEEDRASIATAVTVPASGIDVFSSIYWQRRFGATKRYHGAHLTQEETVFHHSASVAALLIALFGDRCTANLLKAAILHDMEEGVTGDIPAPVKWELGNVNLSDLEKRVRDFYNIRYPEYLTNNEVMMLKAGDTLDAVLKCLEERLRGNISIRWVFRNYVTYIEKACIMDAFPETAELWRKIKKAFEHGDARQNSEEILNAERYNFWANES